MLEALDVAILCLLLVSAGYGLLGLLRPQALTPELMLAASAGLGLALVSLDAWLAYLTGTGMAGAAALSALELVALAAAMVVRRAHRPQVSSWGPAWWSIALAGAMGGLAFLTGPWLSDTADTFYHLAAARALLRDGAALPREIFFNASVPYPDATSGTLHLVLAWLSLPGGMFTAFDAITVFGAAFVVLAFIAFAFELTRSRLGAFGAGLLYLVYNAHFDMRIAGYPNRMAPGLVWLAVAFTVRFARQPGRKSWPELAIAASLGFAAGAVHPGMPPFLLALLIASVGAAAAAALLARRLTPFTSLGGAAAAVILVSLPIMAVRLAALPAPGILDGSFATFPPDLATFVAPWGLPAIDLHFWFDSRFSIPVLATLLLLGPPLRELRRGDPGASVLWGGSLLIPVIAWVPFIADRPQESAYVARIADLLRPLLDIVLAWALAGGAAAILKFLRTGPTTMRAGLMPAVSAGLIVVTGLLSVADARAIARIYRPSGAASVEVSQRKDLSRAWADRIQALGSLGPGVILADATVAYMLAGLTGRHVVAVWTSHVPAQDEARDGDLRRGDVLDALNPSEDPVQLAAILERYQVAYVLLDRDVDSDATWAAAAAQPLYQRVAGGDSWALYRYARENLDAALAIPISAGSGLAPSTAVAGRALFARIPSCCQPGTRVRLTASGAKTGTAFSADVVAAASASGFATVPFLIPDGVPPDLYSISYNLPGSAPTQLGQVAIGRSFEAELFAGVYQEQDSDKDAWPQWVSIHDAAYSRGLASYTRTPDVKATRAIDLPAGGYCLAASVYDPGDGIQRSLTVGIGGVSTTYQWSGAQAGMRELRQLVAVPGGTTELSYSTLMPTGWPVIIDRLVFYPPAQGAPGSC